MAILLMIVSLILFCLSCIYLPLDDVGIIFTTITAIIGALAIWFQMKRDREIKEAELILNYNTSFIEISKCTEIEHVLERYRKQIESGKSIDEIDLILNEENKQGFIDYLVYPEAVCVCKN